MVFKNSSVIIKSNKCRSHTTDYEQEAINVYNILVCDDERDIVSALNIYLKNEGYCVFSAYNGNRALELLKKQKIHLILLDIMMPELDGIQALSLIRENYNIPVILLTAKGEDTDKIFGLNMGSDDYVTKPFNPVELMARVRSQLRRYTSLGGMEPDKKNTICIGNIELNDLYKTVKVSGDTVTLTPTEYNILKSLMERKEQVLSPAEIYRFVWGEEAMGAENSVAVHIRHLREKIEINPSEPRYIKVVWGRGYKITGGTTDEIKQTL